ncbi:ShKT domain-containing protein [Caenorhabditis elegans]|uniref:ShKT domain-containing protein n=1 Tax=Caenorhabditis elegans TaxID=6239 RepID=O45998_CAEEL|nr:ShKT domain-containing protein [Caenorhabditis elegans]CAB04984.1 ShKT domain-containing protein [Caenorhabditis elegans]|eukprot:NP_507329.1 Uncharacterized protein CELE_ZK218.1 [Caenorhabditis elegans]
MIAPIVSILTVALSFVQAQVGPERNCTAYDAVATDFVYTPGATNCVNTYSDKTCESLYAIAAANPAPVPGLKTLRPGKCFTTAATAAVTSPIDADLVRAAVSTCPKTCGYCCQSPDYNCPNVQFPRLNCATILPSQCTNQQFRVIIAQDCPSACGLCNAGGCVDAIMGCANDISICNNVGMQDFVNLNCQRTCSRCSSAPVPGGCTYNRDSGTFCAAWAANGFCQNEFYSPDQRKQYCATTCKIC